MIYSGRIRCAENQRILTNSVVFGRDERFAFDTNRAVGIKPHPKPGN